MKVVEVRCIRHRYAERLTVTICGLSFEVKEGERVIILGPNGSGKTTLVNHIIGLLTPVKGRVRVFGFDPYKNMKKIQDKIGVVLQRVEDQLVGPTVEDDISFTPINLGFDEKWVRKRVSTLLKMFGIQKLRKRVVYHLSGGEKKKVAIAGALAHKPKLLVLDEPFAGIDANSRKRVVEIVKRYCEEENASLVLVTNDLEVVREIGETIYLMENGRIIFKGTLKQLFRKFKDLELCKH